MYSGKSFLKQHSRSTLGITGDILQSCIDAGLDGILVSEMCRKANLSHTAVMKYCKKLIDADLIMSSRNKRCYVFIITEKGIKFFREFQNFLEVIKELNIRF